jgi:cysteine desulfurase
MRTMYLDHAATTPIDPAVLAAMLPYFTDNFYNPSAQYQPAREVKQVINDARATIAQYIGARSTEITFTAGGTEANNLAISGVMAQFPGSELLVSAVEHDSILAPAAHFGAKILPVLSDGRVDATLLSDYVSDQTVLISIQYVNNEIGTIQPLKDITAAIVAIKKDRVKRGIILPLYLHSDACQAGNYLDLHTSRLGVDLMTINASKLYGPKQIGALYCKSGIRFDAQILGGGQERGLRSGTENVPSIVGFARALALVQDRRHEETKRVSKLQHYCIAQLSAKIPQIIVNGSNKQRIANNVHVTIPGHDNETLMMQLDNQGIFCAVGSACSASSEEPSHVLKAIGLDDEAAQSSLRFTFGASTTAEDIDLLTTILAKLIS